MSVDSAEDGLETAVINAANCKLCGEGSHRVPRSRWLECLQTSEQPSIFQHPDVVLACTGSEARPLILVPCGEEESPRAFGLLANVPYRVKLLPTKYGTWRLRGQKLWANHLIGDESEQTYIKFVNSLAGIFDRANNDCIYFEDVEVDSPLWRALHCERREYAAFHTHGAQPHWKIDFPEQPERYWQKFSRKTRHNLRNGARKLEHTAVCYRDKARVAEFLDKAATVSAKSWKEVRLGPRIDTSAQVIHLWETIASFGAMRSYLLEHHGQPIAFQLASQWKGRFVPHEMGYDKTFAGSSPGGILLFRLLEDLIARDTPRTLDFGFGDAEYKRVFGTCQTASGPVLLVRRQFRCLIPIWLQGGRRRVSLACRWALDRLGLRRIVRRWYRG